MTTEPVFIDSLEIENVKCVKAVKIELKGKFLTVIGGLNRQGKTTCLDTICYTLGGERFRPSNLKRDDSLAHPGMKITLSNGLIAERKGKNSTLKVTDPSGKTGGQQLLNQFIHQFALDLPRFLQAKPAEKADILLQIIGVGDELKILEAEETKTYNERLAFGQIADQKQKYANELVEYPDAPDTPVSAGELIKSQQAILAKNGENEKKRQERDRIHAASQAATLKAANLAFELGKAKEEAERLIEDLQTAEKTARELQDQATDEIEEKLNEIDAINVQVRANMDKEKGNEEAAEHKTKYDGMTEKLNGIRTKKKALLDGADLPLPGLSVEKAELLYNGKAWDCMAGSEQYRVATAIVRRLNPKCGFVLIDKLEALDLPTLKEFGEYLQAEGLQAITTRVSQGEECSIIIEDGFSVEDDKKNFTVGEF